MKEIFVYLSGQTILLPFIAGLIRFRRIGKCYQPFFIMVVAGLASEIVDRIVIDVFHSSNAIPSNIYTLVEWILIAWQFHVWGFLKTRKKLFYTLLLFSSLAWATEMLVFHHIKEFAPYFRFFYCFLTVLLSVNK